MTLTWRGCWRETTWHGNAARARPAGARRSSTLERMLEENRGEEFIDNQQVNESR